MNQPYLWVVRSEDRVSGTSSAFKFNAGGDYRLAQMAVKHIDLLEVVIPNTIYNIRSGVNNTFTVTHGGSFTVTLTPGIYTIDDLLTEVAARLLVADNTLSWTATYSAKTKKVSISNVSLTDFTLTFLTTSPDEELGFPLTNNASTIFSSASGVLTATNVFNVGRPYDLHINIQEFGQTARCTKTYNNATFVCTFSVNGGTILDWTARDHYDQHCRFTPPRNIYELNVTLKLGNGEIADLNGEEWAMYFRVHPGEEEGNKKRKI